jgi:hypothetical protein
MLIEYDRLGLVQFALTQGKAVEGHLNPRRCARHDDSQKARSVLDCASPHGALCMANFFRGPECANVKVNYQSEH